MGNGPDRRPLFLSLGEPVVLIGVDRFVLSQATSELERGKGLELPVLL